MIVSRIINIKETGNEVPEACSAFLQRKGDKDSYTTMEQIETYIDAPKRAEFNAEVAARKEADTRLQSNINSEAEARETSDSQLSASIKAEADAREKADTCIQASVTTEAQAREDADTQLQASITTEAKARENADALLCSKIEGACCIHNDDCSACIATLGGSNQVKGSTSIAGDLSVSGNIYQRGETYTTHAEELNVGSSTVTVRADAESAMTPGDYAGIVVCRYDGTNDMNVFVDSEGTARLGKLTSLQPFALRNEAANMTDGALVCWNAADKRIDTACSIDCYTRNLVNKVEKSGTGISYTDVQGCSYNVEITNLKGGSARVSVSDSCVSLCYEADTPHELTLDNEGLRLDGKGLGQGGIVPDAELNYSSFGVLTHCDISPFCVYQCVSRCNGVAIGTMQWLDADSVCVGGHCVTGAGYIMTGSGKPFCSWSHVEALFLGNGSVYFNSYRNGASEGDGTNVKVSRPLAQVESWDGSTLCLRG